MDNFLKKRLLAAAAFFWLLFYCSCSSCSFDSSARQRSKISLSGGIKIATWNAQTFFDAVESGGEYAEFRGSNSRWNEERYKERLKRLCAVIQKLDADVVALQEIENEAVVRDIANMLPVTAAYRFAAFAKDEANPFGQAVLSRLELESVKTRQLFLQTQDFPVQPDLRPIMEVVCRFADANEPRLELFICHWKSKSGGEEKSEIWRERQERLLLDAAASFNESSGDSERIVIALGDFNRDPHEFSSTFFDYFSDGWNAADEGGSYFYQNNWNRIDHIFFAKKSPARFGQFLAENEGPHVQPDGHPFRYNVFSGEGYSDHLPVSAVVAF